MAFQNLPRYSWEYCRGRVKSMLQQYYSRSIPKAERTLSHIHTHTPITGVTLSTDWSEFPLNHANLDVISLDGFTTDLANNKIVWDADGSYNTGLSAIFIGSAALEVTAGLGAGVTVYMGLFVDDVLVLESPVTFDVLNRISNYSGNCPLVDDNGDDYFVSGSSYKIKSRASAGTPTITVHSLSTTLMRVN